MEAHRPWGAASLVAALFALLSLAPAEGAQHRSANFVVSAHDADVARQVAEVAEASRKSLAVEWLGHELPNWYRPCPVRVTIGEMGAGGATTFTFDRGEVAGWNMNVQGSLERVLDSVIPHEVSHTIFASYFRRPLPRWADEGAATLIEHVEERKRQEVLLNRVVETRKLIPLNNLFQMTEYPQEMEKVYTLYAEGYSLARYLVQLKGGEDGRRTFLAFLQDAHTQGWTKSLRKHFGYESVADLEQEWMGWVVAGSPQPRRDGDAMLAKENAEAGTDDSAEVAAAPSHLASSGSGEVSEPASKSTKPAPLPSLARARRGVAAGEPLSAPAPGEGQIGWNNPRPMEGAVSRVAIADRVVPRRDPAPNEPGHEASRMRYLMAQAGLREQRHVSTARTTDPDGAVMRGQSPPADWSAYAMFPGQQTASESSATASREPFSE
jgi:hypothetical protein